jgi:hypothetical protein
MTRWLADRIYWGIMETIPSCWVLGVAPFKPQNETYRKVNRPTLKTVCTTTITIIQYSAISYLHALNFMKIPYFSSLGKFKILQHFRLFKIKSTTSSHLKMQRSL